MQVERTNKGSPRDFGGQWVFPQLLLSLVMLCLCVRTLLYQGEVVAVRLPSDLENSPEKYIHSQG